MVGKCLLEFAHEGVVLRTVGDEELVHTCLNATAPSGKIPGLHRGVAWDRPKHMAWFRSSGKWAVQTAAMHLEVVDPSRSAGLQPASACERLEHRNRQIDPGVFKLKQRIRGLNVFPIGRPDQSTPSPIATPLFLLALKRPEGRAPLATGGVRSPRSAPFTALHLPHCRGRRNKSSARNFHR